MVWYARGLLRLTVATTLAVIGLTVAFVLAPAQDSTAAAPAGYQYSTGR